MFGVGVDEIFVIAVLFLIFIGPKGMPTTFRALGKGLREFRKSMREIRHQVGIDEILQQDLFEDTMREHKESFEKSLSSDGSLDDRVAHSKTFSEAEENPSTDSSSQSKEPTKDEHIPSPSKES